MKITHIHIENFRGIQTADIPINSFTCLIGANGSGKSTILQALNLFFGDPIFGGIGAKGLTREDFYMKDTSSTIKVTLTFEGLNEEAQNDFKDYYRDGKLIMTVAARFDTSSPQPSKRRYGTRMVMEQFAAYFAAMNDGKLVAELRAIYTQIKNDFPQYDLPNETQKNRMYEALRAFESRDENRILLKPSDSNDDFYGVSSGKDRFDKHMIWVFVPAVKDASSEEVEARNTALGKILSRVVEDKAKLKEGIQQLKDQVSTRYSELLRENESALNSISDSLSSRMREWAHPEASLRLKWRTDETKSVTVGEPVAEVVAAEYAFEGSLNHFGHGYQRSYLLALLQELADVEAQSGPQLILGIEEPELFQHPPQIRHLASVFEKLVLTGTQLMITTHSPLLVIGESFEDVRLVRRPTAGPARVSYLDAKKFAERLQKCGVESQTLQSNAVLARIQTELQPAQNEMFFCSVPLLVEGIEDVAYLTTYLTLAGQWWDFRRMGMHFVPVGGKSHLVHALAIALEIGIAPYVIFDCDGAKIMRGGNSNNRHIADNKKIFTLMGYSEPVYDGKILVKHQNLIAWPNEIASSFINDFQDKEICAKIATTKQNIENSYGKPGSLNKNPLFISEMLVNLWDSGIKSKTLLAVCQSIIDFGISTRQAVMEEDIT